MIIMISLYVIDEMIPVINANSLQGKFEIILLLSNLIHVVYSIPIVLRQFIKQNIALSI